MSGQDIVRERVWRIARRVADSEGLELVDVELHGRGPGMILKVFLDKPGGVTHGDCQGVSRQLGAILDVEDVINSRYTLEVSSPGMDRKLTKVEDYQRFTGNLASVTMNDVEGQKHFRGRLAGVVEGRIVLQMEDGEMQELSMEGVASARLVPEFPGKKSPRKGPSKHNSR